MESQQSRPAEPYRYPTSILNCATTVADATLIAMDADDKHFMLLEHLEPYRAWPYASLVTAIQRTRNEHDCLKHIELIHSDGTECQIEINVFWDGPAGGDVRVCADITTPRQRPWLGFLPVFTPDASDSFIMAPDGRFVGG